jgi:hypothetical protein
MTPRAHHGGALDADRFRWLNAVRREAEALGVAWVYTDPSFHETWRPDPIARKALGLDGALGN